METQPANVTQFISRTTYVTVPIATDKKGDQVLSMAKGSVRKKGKKWYYRFYVEDESGKMVQREFAGTESKSETEALLLSLIHI